MVLRDQHGLGGSGAAVDAHEAFHHLARLERGRHELLGAVLLLEGGQVGIVLGQPAAAAALRFLFLAADVDVPFELLEADVMPDRVVFALAELHRADGGEVLRVVRRRDEVFGRHAFGQRRVALFPDLRDVALPAIAHALDVAVRAAEQQHHGLQRVAARQHRQVLHARWLRTATPSARRAARPSSAGR